MLLKRKSIISSLVRGAACSCVALCVGAVHAQTAPVWDLEGTTEIISGVAYDETAGLIVDANNDIWYVAEDGGNSSTASHRGNVAGLFSEQLDWFDDQSIVYFENDPSSSPTGSPINVLISLDAVAYEIFEVGTGTSMGYFVGLLETYQISSGAESGEMVIFAPAALTSDLGEAYEWLMGLAVVDSPVLFEGGDQAVPSCADQCANAYNTASANARDRFTVAVDGCTSNRRVLTNGAVGCALGGAICTIALGPLPGVFCCILGGYLYANSEVKQCIYDARNILQSDLRAAWGDYQLCMLNECGITVAHDGPG